MLNLCGTVCALAVGGHGGAVPHTQVHAGDTRIKSDVLEDRAPVLRYNFSLGKRNIRLRRSSSDRNHSTTSDRPPTRHMWDRSLGLPPGST
jgi:hypothetical protein